MAVVCAGIHTLVFSGQIRHCADLKTKQHELEKELVFIKLYF